MNKIYVITGSTSGIGRALTEKLSVSNLVYAGFRKSEHEDMLKDISSNVIPFYIDYEKPSTVESAAKFIIQKVEKIDTLVNIAGCVVAGPVEKLDINEVRRQFDVNVFGHLEFTQNLLDKMENGKIINVSSMASYGIFPFISPYCASKKCLDMFFNSLLIESKRNIKVVSIKPGVIATPLWGKSIKENSKFFNRYGDYSAEMEYVLANARENENNGLTVEKVVEVIMEADSKRSPKLSYTVGNDALFASIISKLPQSWINHLVKLGIKLRIKNTSKSK